jgi:superfamily II DNA/RNA helicase
LTGISSRRFFGGKNVDIEKEKFLFGTNLDSKKSFQDIEISEALVYSLRASQKSSPTQIQAAAFHPIFDGKDVVIGAETGSGKTLAYFLPIFQRMLNGLIPRDSPKYPAIYILVPSKELCQQVGSPIFRFLG